MPRILLAFAFVFSIALLAGLPACKKKPTAAQASLAKQQAFQTAQKDKAIKAYNDLVTKYPDSEFAPKAKERLNVLGPPSATATPAKK